MFEASTHILIVDDMSTMRKIVAKSCRDLGFSNLHEAVDGIDAWEKISAANPSIGVVISDWSMPRCSGLDLLKRVRAESRFKFTPFILLTAETEKSQVEEAVKAGVSGYVLKPFNSETLRQRLDAAYKKFRS